MVVCWGWLVALFKTGQNSDSEMFRSVTDPLVSSVCVSPNKKRTVKQENHLKRNTEKHNKNTRGWRRVTARGDPLRPSANQHDSHLTAAKVVVLRIPFGDHPLELKRHREN